MSDYKNDVVVGELDGEGIATLTIDMKPVNKLNEQFGQGLAGGVEWLQSLGKDLTGVILATGQKNFCVGADIDMMYKQRDPEQVYEGTRQLNQLYRALEGLDAPVVCALTGSALGGGYELALATNHRIALNDGRIKLGLPEVMLGVIPGSGGTQRLPRLVGIQQALEIILAGAMLPAPVAKKKGLVDDLAETPEELREKAVAWIRANKKAKQPWDVKGATIPGPQPGTMEAMQLFMGAQAMLYKKTAGAMKAPEIALAAVQDGLGLDFDRSLEVEGRYFAKVAVSDQAKDMMRLMWFFRTGAEKGEGLPKQDHGFKKVGILGAGMMGAGLAWVCAKAGMEVVVKDIAAEALEAGKKHCDEQTKKKLKHKSQEERDALNGRIKFTLEYPDLEGCDLVIEAVVEDDGVKAKVTEATEPLMAEGGIFASNTSAIPITHLAKASKAPERFIGLHFFSPVEKMPLLEIIRGEQTDDATLARCVSFGLAIGKMPIVVGDGYGFYTSRTFAKYLMEGVQLVAEGHAPALIEEAARQAGMIVPPLKVFDEVTLRLGYKGVKQREKYMGEVIDAPGVRLLKTLVEEHGRIGKVEGAGFYDYDGRKRRLWPGLRELVDATPGVTGMEYIQDRLMLTQAVEAARCLDEGILSSAKDGDVGGVFGIGFAPGYGGPFGYMDRRGIAAVVARCDELAQEPGGAERFAPPELLRRMAAEGATFYERV